MGEECRIFEFVLVEILALESVTERWFSRDVWWQMYLRVIGLDIK